MLRKSLEGLQNTEDLKGTVEGVPSFLSEADKAADPRGTSWKAVEQIEDRERSTTEQSYSGSEGSDNEEIRIKDLDTGREFNVAKKYTITDLNTGQLFALCTNPESPEAGPQEVTDFASGRQLSLEEFDAALGLSRQANFLKSKAQGLLSDSESMREAGRNLANGPGKKKKNWLKKIQFKKNKTVAIDADDSESGSATSTPKVDDGSNLQRSSGAPSVSGRGTVKVLVHKKLHKDLTDLRLVQSLNGHTGTVWAMKFSPDGKYLATAGHEGLVLVWQVLAAATQTSSGVTSAGDAGLSEPSGSGQPPASYGSSGREDIFASSPQRSYKGHKLAVLDLAWSKSLFLLTASMDKSVRLWHVSMDDCLRVFRHSDFVTALDFHPIDDKYFVSGSIDGKVRIWNIPEQNGRVVDYADVHEMVTATTFSTDGRRAVIGTMKGKCQFYHCSSNFKLEYEAQIDVKNRRGRTAKGRKVTGLHFMPTDPTKLLITSNDSRIRMYDGYTLRCKYKGLQNANTQIRASFSQDGEYIICGSDDGFVYFWPTGLSNTSSSKAAMQAPKQGKTGAYECFHAHNDIATVAIFAPDSARRIVPKQFPIEKVSTPNDSLQRIGKKLTKEEAAEAREASEVAISTAKAKGQILLTAGYDGEVRIFENVSSPLWL